MKILLVNDDGIQAEGIRTLAKTLAENKHEVYVVAPDGERSGVAHCTIYTKPLKFYSADDFSGAVKAYAFGGCPADCVKFGVHHLFDFDFDLIVSGINHGPNLGTDVFYSGTCAAALEGKVMGISSIAVSCTAWKDIDFTAAAEFTAEFIGKTDFSQQVTYNINVPNLKREDIKGVKYTPLGVRKYTDHYEMRLNDMEEEAYLLMGDPIDDIENHPDCDVEWNKAGYITVTPLMMDITDYKALEKLK